MKKNIILLLMFTAFAGVANAQIRNGIVSVGVFWGFNGVRVDSLTCNDGLTESEHYKYDAAGRMVYEYILSNEPYYVDDEYVGTKLEDMLRERTYNDNGKIVSYLFKSKYFDSDAWVINDSLSYEYGSDGRLSCMTRTKLESKVTKEMYSYDDQSNTTTRTEYYGITSEPLTKTSVVEFKYDANHLLTSKDSCAFNGEATSYYRNKYAYDNDGRLMTDTSFVKIDDNWVYSTLCDYTYGEYGSTTSLLYNYTDGEWVTYKKDTNIIDKYNNIIDQSLYEWDGSSWVLSGGYTHAITYNEDGNPLTIEKNTHINLPFFSYDDLQKSELKYEDSKVIENVYKKNNDKWELSYTTTYYVSNLNGTTGIEAIQNTNETSGTKKALVNGKLYVMNNDKTYNAAGQRIK